jgi:formylglycine-generating enzyme required for sulfatase activity
VTATAEDGGIYAQVAHEAIFRRWDKLREWITQERDFLAWKSDLEGARRRWEGAPQRSQDDALLMGFALAQAQDLSSKRAEDLPTADLDFINQSVRRESKARIRARRAQVVIYVLLVGIIVGLVGWINQSYIKQEMNWYWTGKPFAIAHVWPHILTSAAEQALKPVDRFRECEGEEKSASPRAPFARQAPFPRAAPPKDYCPEMVVVSAGSFVMGSSPTEGPMRSVREGPQHLVTIAKPFAVSKFEVTFEEWDTCVAYGDCPDGVSDFGWGRGSRPVMNVSWYDAQGYVAWLSKMTGKLYRLLTEAEFEYAARAGAQTPFPWGDDIGNNNANCKGCGSEWDSIQTAPVGSFPVNAFGLHDMIGNVWEWVEDCYHSNYDEAPTDGSAWNGSAWSSGDCSRRMIRGGSWAALPGLLRSAFRNWGTAAIKDGTLGFRVARTLRP